MKRTLGSGTGCGLMTAILAGALAVLSGCGGGNNGSSGPPPTPVTTPGTAVVYPGTASVPLGGSVNFLANLPSQPAATFTWTIPSGSGNGSINSSTGVYTAPTGAVPNPATITVTATATSGNFVGTASLTITAAQPVTMSPSALVVKAGSQVTIAATSGGNPASVTQWQVNGAAPGDTVHGFISNSGQYTAPLTPPPGGTTTITAVTAGGSGTTNVTVVYSNLSFNGPYAYSYSGTDGKGLLEVAGHFTANGSAGTIAGGIEDVSSGNTGVTSFSPNTGTFNVGADGTGTATLSDGSTLAFVLTMNSAANASKPAQKALLVRFDGTGTGSGVVEQQDPLAVNTPFSTANRNYAFNLSGSGIDNGQGAILATAGVFTSDGSGSSTGTAEWDVNIGGTPVMDNTLGVTFSSDLNNPGTGRGFATLTSSNGTLNGTTINIKTLKFSVYVVDATHVMAVETDNIQFASGDFFSSPSGPFSTSLLAAGGYAFTTAGTSTVAAYSQGGIFTSNGSGSLLPGGVMDVNGGSGHILLAMAVAQNSYTVDATGRIALALSGTLNNTTFGPWHYAGYMISASTWVPNGGLEMVQIDAAGSGNGGTNIPGTGLMTVLSGTAFGQNSKPALTGSYGSAFTSVANTNNGALEEDIAGQFAVVNTAIATGSLNTNLFGTTTLGVPITSAALAAPDTNGRGVATIATHVETYPLAYYIIDGNSVLAMETDSQRVLVGNIERQF